MKVSEAIDLLKKYPNDCEIYLNPNGCEIHHCKDWEDTDENGNIICPNLIYLYRLRGITNESHMEEFHKGCEVEVVDKVIILCDMNEEPTIID